MKLKHPTGKIGAAWRRRWHFTAAVLLFWTAASASLSAQGTGSASAVRNLDMFYTLADSAASMLVSSLPVANVPVTLSFNLPGSYSVFRAAFTESLKKRNMQLYFAGAADSSVSPGSTAPVSAEITIDRADLDYHDSFRDGWFGDVKARRSVKLGGSFVILNNGAVSQVKRFQFASSDTVLYDDLKNIENSEFPFTRSEYPPEPFFQNMVEPVIAVGAAAAAVYLFFTIRSK